MNIHILGIVGSKTAPMAVMLKKMGHNVSGSDQQKVYPPFSTLLQKNNIPINSTKISHDLDLVIVGNSYQYFENCRLEFELTKKLKIPYISFTNYLVKSLFRPESILVAGAYGKTTITSLLSFIFTRLNLDPSYMFGGSCQNKIPSIRFGKSPYSIVESDENHNGLDSKPTFLYYPSKYLILTSVLWEHKESFASEEENLQAYQSLVNQVPEDGAIIYNSEEKNIIPLLDNSKCQLIPYKFTSPVKSKLIGAHNQQNISAALSLCEHLKLDKQLVLKAISNFKGIKRRLQIISNKNNIIIVDDFAQSAKRVKSSLDAIKQSFPHYKIFVYFEPHASFLQHKASITDFASTFLDVDTVVLSKIIFSTKIDKSNRTTAQDWLSINRQNIKYLPINEDIIEYFSKTLKPNSILIHFSSGGLEGLRVLKIIKKNILDIHS